MLAKTKRIFKCLIQLYTCSVAENNNYRHWTLLYTCWNFTQPTWVEAALSIQTANSQTKIDFKDQLCIGLGNKTTTIIRCWIKKAPNASFRKWSPVRVSPLGALPQRAESALHLPRPHRRQTGLPRAPYHTEVRGWTLRGHRIRTTHSITKSPWPNKDSSLALLN